MAKPKLHCDACGAVMKEYTFTFNKALAVFLKKLYDTGVPTKTASVGLRNAQYTNSPKLKYWDLAIPHITPENNHKRGWWVITEKGKSFVEGKIQIPKSVVMYRNEFVRFEGNLISFNDVHDGYLYRGDYAAQGHGFLEGMSP